MYATPTPTTFYPTQQISTRFISATSGLLITIPPISVQDWGRVSVPGSLPLHLLVVDDEKGLLWYRFGVVVFVEDSSSRFFLTLFLHPDEPSLSRTPLDTSCSLWALHR